MKILLLLVKNEHNLTFGGQKQMRPNSLDTTSYNGKNLYARDIFLKNKCLFELLWKIQSEEDLQIMSSQEKKSR